jgi:hypothetical protein
MNVLKDLTTLKEIQEQLDIFIKNNPPDKENENSLNMSTQNAENGIYAYNYIKKKVPEKDTFYTQFGNHGNGNTCFYLYKNKKGIIYLFVILLKNNYFLNVTFILLNNFV